MGFLSGRVTFSRLRVAPPGPGIFGPDHLKALSAHAAGKQRIAAADGIEVGWAAGDHILDTRFDLAKNIINDALLFAMRVDTQKLPADLQRAYFQIELEALVGSDPEAKPSSRQKKEAKEAAMARLDQEAKDGRFVKRKHIPVMWDAKSNELLVGSTSATAIEQMQSLFERSFDIGFEAVTAGRLAYRLAEMRKQTRNVDDAAPSVFVPGFSPADVAWIPDQDSRDFLGNEFLLWLWYILERDEGEIKLADDSVATVLLSRSLTLECPRGQTGHETISSEGPTRLPESRRAIRAGKLPRKMGMTIVRHDSQYDLALQAEILAVGSARLPPPEEEQVRPRHEARIDQIRHLIETLDLLYDAFGQVRCSEQWSKELGKIQKWLTTEKSG
ncbi:MAG TPA: hypothetical protein VKS79_02830 [Gemmataceae bacterium]|nr:hypothetical protein [Gemmataceae bacterium]